MILRQDHIELRLIDESTIELLRVWRNSDEINQFMDYQANITKEEQTQWFRSLSKDENYYFIIHSNSKPVGMIHLSKIQANKAQSGIFIADNQFQGTGVAFTASLLLLDFAFGTLSIKTINAKINDNNKPAQDYNKFLGFKLGSKLNKSFSRWTLEKEDYLGNREFLKGVLA